MPSAIFRSGAIPSRMRKNSCVPSAPMIDSMPLWPAELPPLANANRAQRQIQFVVNHNQVGFRPDLMLGHQFTNRHAAQVHEGLWLGQQHLLRADHRPRRQRTTLAISHFHAAVIGDAVNGEKAQIVRRELVFHARIAQPDNQFHACSIFLTTEARRASAQTDRPSIFCSQSYRPVPTTVRADNASYFFSFFSGFSGLLGGRLRAFFALDLLLALLDDFGLGRSRSSFGGNRFRRRPPLLP